MWGFFCLFEKPGLGNIRIAFSLVVCNKLGFIFIALSVILFFLEGAVFEMPDGLKFLVLVLHMY
jgi:hypothetical protein